MLSDRPPSHVPLGLVAGASFVLVALAAFASIYVLVLGTRAPATSSPEREPGQAELLSAEEKQR